MTPPWTACESCQGLGFQLSLTDPLWCSGCGGSGHGPEEEREGRHVDVPEGARCYCATSGQSCSGLTRKLYPCSYCARGAVYMLWDTIKLTWSPTSITPEIAFALLTKPPDQQPPSLYKRIVEWCVQNDCVHKPYRRPMAKPDPEVRTQTPVARIPGGIKAVPLPGEVWRDSLGGIEVEVVDLGRYTFTGDTVVIYRSVGPTLRVMLLGDWTDTVVLSNNDHVPRYTFVRGAA